MAASTSDMSFWIKYFTEAGIPAGDAANYAVTFTDNRISRSMLMDLSKEYLNDMGIKILGDVIAILKHAKTVISQDARDRAFQDTSTSTTKGKESPVPRRSTPASRIVGHYIGSERSASPSTITASQSTLSKELSARLGTPKQAETRSPKAAMIRLSTTPKEVVPVPKNRRVFPEHEGKYKISMPSGTTARTRRILEQQRKKAEDQRIKAEKARVAQASEKQKTSVFSRLGSEKPKSEPTITVTGLDSLPMSSTQSSVFSRLGGKTAVKRAATSTVALDDEDLDLEDEPGPSLEYAGVFKDAESPSKKAKVETAKRLKKTAQKRLSLRVQQEDVSTTTAGVLSPHARHEQANIRSRLGPKKADEVSSTQTSVSKKQTVKKTVTTQGGIQGRIGEKTKDGDIKIRVGVFGRLGKPS